ncbi:MAG: hypothetical protein M3383_03690, partial [Actinomycetota bacterium]|nr:hypothetical protein [Actinomycetota bacterium]
MRVSRQDGQATPEWLGVVLVVALAFAALVSLGVRLPGAALARAIGERLICAVELGGGCGGVPGDLALAYGPELAALASRHAPALHYEEGMRALPVDFRDCREDRCAEGPGAGEVRRSLAGEPVTVFTHVIDCRDPQAATDVGFDCSGERAGNLYLQYWLYYPGSQTSRYLFGEQGHHPDDWESFMVRLNPSGEAVARASSHHGYNGYDGDPINDAGLLGGKPAWVDSTGRYSISGGSHAGRVGAPPSGPVRLPRSIHRGPHRWTPARAVRLIPLE